jgi:hypothetical protein
MKEPAAASPARRLAVLGVLATVCALWLMLTVLKETPVFWRNAGGYPVGLRFFVLDFYYPITALLLVCGLAQLVRLFRGGRPSRAELILVLAFWVLFSSGSGLLVANNVVNAIEGRPLHWHSNDR